MDLLAEAASGMNPLRIDGQAHLQNRIRGSGSASTAPGAASWTTYEGEVRDSNPVRRVPEPGFLCDE